MPFAVVLFSVLDCGMFLFDELQKNILTKKRMGNLYFITLSAYK
jgi:hypothetical protein